MKSRIIWYLGVCLAWSFLTLVIFKNTQLSILCAIWLGVIFVLAGVVDLKNDDNN